MYFCFFYKNNLYIDYYIKNIFFKFYNYILYLNILINEKYLIEYIYNNLYNIYKFIKFIFFNFKKNNIKFNIKLILIIIFQIIFLFFIFII